VVVDAVPLPPQSPYILVHQYAKVIHT
jgi:hypothetical protein